MKVGERVTQGHRELKRKFDLHEDEKEAERMAGLMNWKLEIE